MAKVFIGDKEYFPGIAAISYAGKASDNPLAFKFYDADKIVGDKTMAEHLRFAVCYWHTFCGKGRDPFGEETQMFAWDDHADAMTAAHQRMDAAFEFFTKLGVPYYCFHDRDVAPEGSSVAESEKRLRQLVEAAKQRQQETGMKLLWGTANLFNYPRYMNGAATNPDFHVVSHAAAQVKAAIDATIELGGENYVFWGGREGYTSLVNTNTRRELDHMAVSIVEERPHRASGELAYHVLDIMHAIHEASSKGQHITLESTCERPAPLSRSLLQGLLD